jgi:hypothetical protein
LYIADILLEDMIHRFGYADDICVYRTGRSLEENTKRLSKGLNQILDWGEENKGALDLEKCELIHYTRAKTPVFPDVTVPKHNFKFASGTSVIVW